MNTRVVGSHYIPKLMERVCKAEKNKMRIPNKSDQPYPGPSITNPNLALIMENQKNTLGAYVGQVGNIRVTQRRDLQLHPLHERIPIPRETIQMLTKSATPVFKKLYHDSPSSWTVDRLGEILCSPQKSTPKMYKLIIKQRYTLTRHPNINGRWTNVMKIRVDGKTYNMDHTMTS